MVRKWLIDGRRYGPNGQVETGSIVYEDESVLSLVVEGSLVTANRSGLAVRLWGCRLNIAYESVTALKMAILHNSDVVLLDLVLPGRNGFRMARRLRIRAEFKEADLIAMRSNPPDDGLFHVQEQDFNIHLVKTVNPTELRELLAAVEENSLATSL
jgi:two-component system OmpR family response regulator